MNVNTPAMTAEGYAEAFSIAHDLGAHATRRLTELLTTYAEQVRREATERCAKWHESKAAECIERATNHHPAGAVYGRIMDAANAHLSFASAIRNLPPSPQSSGTTPDTAA